MKVVCNALIKNLVHKQLLRSIPFSLSTTLFRTSLYNFSTTTQNNSLDKGTSQSFQMKNQGQEKDNDSQKQILTNFIQCKKTLKILQQKGIQHFFPIQIETYQHIYNGQDILASDRTGSGKTIAYSLPVIQRFRNQKIFGSSNNVKFVVFCPTRELAIQVQKQISSLKHNRNDFAITTVYGGASMEKQIRQIQNGIDIIVATPGRFIDLVQRGVIELGDIQATCIDEADQMLQKGFKLEIQKIYQKIQSQVKQKPQNLMFSATLPDWVSSISKRYLNKNKIRINLISKSEQQTSMTVKHFAVQCSNNQQISVLKGLIKSYNPKQRTIIFAQRKRDVIDLAHQFQNRQVSFLQGDMSQRQRQTSLDAFRQKKTKILIATDVASRGLDINDVGLVIQLEPCRTTEPYIHRSGRTGRAGKSGISITLFNSSNVDLLINIQRQAKIPIKVIEKPTDVQAQSQWQEKVDNLQKNISKTIKKQVKCEQINQVSQKLLQYYDPKDLVRTLIMQSVGIKPQSKSLITKQSGKTTYVFQMKNQEIEQQMDKIQGLNFISKYQKNLGIQNVRSQSQNFIFDISESNSQKIEQLKKELELKKMPYNIRIAYPQDKQLGKLKDFGRGSYNRRQANKTSFSSSYKSHNDGQRQNNYNNNSSQRRQSGAIEQKTVFVSRVPFEMSQQQFQNNLAQNNIKFDSVRLKRKVGQKGQFAFAFIHFKDQEQTLKALQKKAVHYEDGSKGFMKLSEKR